MASDPISTNTTWDVNQLHGWMRENFHPDFADGMAQALGANGNINSLLQGGQLDPNFAQKMGSAIGLGNLPGFGLLSTFAGTGNVQQAAQAQTRAAPTAVQPQTSPPVPPNTVNPIIKGVKDEDRVIVGADWKFPEGPTAGEVYAAMQAPEKVPGDHAGLARDFGVVAADAPANSPNQQVQLSVPKWRVQGAGGPAAAAGGAAAPGAPAAAPGVPGVPGVTPGAAAAPAAAAAAWSPRNSPISATTAGVSTAGALGLASLGSSGGIFGLASIGTFGSAASALQMAGMSGPAFTLNKVVRSISTSYSDSSFITMLHSNMNIEALLYYWMSYASDKYDKKLREKMEEWTLQTQLEDQQDRNKSLGNMVSGILGIVPGAGQAAGAVVNGVVNTYNTYLGATQGTGKSSTVLAQEVQILIQQWKVITDMTSNLSKDINDMAMTAVRNLR